MTDNEIIKALECCAKDDCKSCPLSDYDGCKSLLFDGDMVLTLINRQKAEIERLTDSNEHLAVLLNEANAEIEKISKLLKLEAEGANTLNDVIAERDAEIKELKSDIAILKDSNINLQELYYNEKEKVTQAKTKVVDACKMRKTAKSEAIKEFAKRLKEKEKSHYDYYYNYNILFDYIEIDTIDNLVKEMVGEGK